ncbi:hypothetical protein OAV88_01050 [bacterium]|nr:hypothetical protein [bacterium]
MCMSVSFYAKTRRRRTYLATLIMHVSKSVSARRRFPMFCCCC